MAIRIWRLFSAAIGAVAGVLIARVLIFDVIEPFALWNYLHNEFFMQFGNLIVKILCAVLFAIIGYIIALPILSFLLRLSKSIEERVGNMPRSNFIAGFIGLAAGLFISFLISVPLSAIPIIGPFMPFLVAVVLGYLGISLGLRWREDILAFVQNRSGRGRNANRHQEKASEVTDLKVATVQSSPTPKILDTSVIIDGRIADIVETGFLEGPLVVAQCVLDELRHIADNADNLKRNRGRRGLDVLNRLKSLDIEIIESDVAYDDVVEVDAKLVRLARDMHGYVVTNDYNLNKVASFQNVKVLNVNELAGAIKTVVLPGETMTLDIVAEGKDADQGVGYLDDGTMIVVEGGRKHIGKTVQGVVTSVIQTNAGRMIFVRIKENL